MGQLPGKRFLFLCPQCRQTADKCTCPPPPEPVEPAVQESVVRVGRETKGRRGKGVTIISDLVLNGPRMEELAKRLKQRLGTGGSVKDGRIEIQGDQRDRVAQELERLGYRVKRAGG